MAKQVKPIQVAAAAPAAAAPVASTLAELVASGVLLVVAGDEAAPAPAEEQIDFAFDSEIFRRSVDQLSAEDFALAFDAMLAAAYEREHIAPLDLRTEQDQPQEVELLDEHAATRALLRRYKLPQAWQDAQGEYHFDEKAAFAAQATTVILPEVDEAL